MDPPEARIAQIDTDMKRLQEEAGDEPASPKKQKTVSAMSDYFQAPLNITRIQAQRNTASPKNGKGALCSARCEVISTPRNVTGTNNAQKITFELRALSISSNGAHDVIDSGVPGNIYLIPTVMTGGPDGERKRSLHIDDEFRPTLANRFRTDHYKYAPDKTSNNLEEIREGSIVEVTGLCLNAVPRENDDGTTVVRSYVNCLRITPLSSQQPTRIDLASTMVKRYAAGDAQKLAAVSAGIALGGYPSRTGAPEQLDQINAYLKVWADGRERVAKRLEEIATFQDDREASILIDEAVRVRALDVNALAAGLVHFFPRGEYDRTYIPIVQFGCIPRDPTPVPVRQLIDKDANLPDQFVAASLVHHEARGAQLTLGFRIGVCHDTPKANDAIDKNGAAALPITGAKNIVTAMNLSYKYLAHHILAVPDKDGAKLFVGEVFPIATMYFLGLVNPPNGDVNGEIPPDIAVKFPDSFGLDMAATLANFLIVTLGWINEHLCAGTGVYAADELPIREPFEKPDKQIIDPARMSNAGYQELTRTQFAIGWLKPGTGKHVEYRVIYSGARHDIIANPLLATDAAAGEAHLKACATMHPAFDGNVTAWLLHEALVFAVAVSD